MTSLTKKQHFKLHIIIGIILIPVIVIVTSIIIIQLYNSNHNKKILEASNEYQKVLISSENPYKSSNKKIYQFKAITDEYPNTSLGIFASWQIVYITLKDLENSSLNMNITELQEIIKILQNSISNNNKESLSNITKTRLARFYLELNQTDLAIKTLQSLGTLKNQYYPMTLLGIAYHQKNDKIKALDAWYKALKDNDSSYEFKQLITQLINKY